MKINPRLILALIAASSLSAAPLTKPTAVHVRPDASSPAIAVLTAGTEPALAINVATPPPAGWTAIELSGPHEVYVQNKDILKSLDVRPGASLYTQPKVDAPVLTTMAKGDSAEISGLHGRWTQIRLQKKVVGYIGEDGASSPVVAAAVGASTTGKAAPAPAPVAIDPAASAYTGTGRSAPTVTPAGTNAPALPRLFEGTFIPAKRFLAYKPYDYQLNDRAGQRYAFLDVSHMMKAEQFSRYLDKTVVIYGTAKPIPDTKDIVIVVESMQLR